MSCQKIPYDSKELAGKDAIYIRNQNVRFSRKQRGKKKSGKKLRPYHCQLCCKWHLTSQKQTRKK